MAPCLDMKPSLGIIKTSYLAVANKAPHPNAAKLFIKFALSPDGYQALGRAWHLTRLNRLSRLPKACLPFEEVMAKVWLMNPIFDWEWAPRCATSGRSACLLLSNKNRTSFAGIEWISLDTDAACPCPKKSRNHSSVFIKPFE